ncbi:hypothetical protein Pmani_030666 [Petrolisthes manimaculis]|uniref:ER membrane protein complex subunit 10 n=1 Tax=Petrolisthes manimaculis TaxID=1843537 RepID=A0AAE1NWV4_9EUCA|nr:hypothetical protein Pmani_030666 [Petrolisthes manimaculis]
MVLPAKNLSCFTVLFLAFTASLAFQEDEFLDGQLTLVIEDALEGGPDPIFTQRSTIQVRSVKSGNAVVTHTRPWTNDLNEKLKKLVEADDLYHIRVYQKGSEEKGYVSTFTKACQVFESRLSETLSLMVDGSGTSVVGVWLITPVCVCDGEENGAESDNGGGGGDGGGGEIIPSSSSSLQHNTTVIIRSPIPAPVPDTATYIEKLEAMKNEKAEGKDNRSFLAKYWMYIVPLVLIMVVFGGGQDGGR